MQPTTTVGRTNGHARQFDVLKLGDTTEERREVELNARTLWAWVTTNARYPASVAAQLDDARNTWLASRKPVDPTATVPGTLWTAVLDLADLLETDPDAEQIAEAAREVARLARDLEQEPEMRSTEVEWQSYLTRALCALIPGLEQYDADLLSPQKRITALSELGYLRAPRAETPPSEGEQPKDEDEGEGDGEREPEAEGGEPQAPPEPGPSSTGEEPEPDSAGTTE